MLETTVRLNVELLELVFDGDDGRSETLWVTGEHPIWSLTRDDWVRAAELDTGETVDTLTGPLTLSQSASLGHREPVYNLEVEEAHSYFVGESGIWAHNRCLRPSDLGLSSKTVTALDGSIVNAGTTRIISVENVVGKLSASELRGALPHILQSARDAGVRTLQIEGRFANERLQSFVFKQARSHGATISEGSTDIMTFILGVP